MKKILIANRGEIACRIINSCKKLKFHSIAVYSDIDKNSKHVRKADESIHIGASKAQESYLNADKIIEAAKKLKADAIHPGYGFLAENEKFAQKVIDSGIIWVNTWMLRDLRIPFGGMKESGLGREGGFKSLQFFTEPKNVCIKI